MFQQLVHELFWRRGRELFVELQHQQMPNAKLPDQIDLVFSGREQVRDIVRPEDFGRVRIKRYYDRRPFGGVCVPG